MNVADAIKAKRAVRQFQERPIPDEVIDSILNAGRRAQSAKNSQPWHFIAIQDKGTLRELSELGNFAGHLAGAAFGVAIVTPHFTQRFSVMFDAGQAAAYMQLAAWEQGIVSCLATIYEPEKAGKLLGIPEDLYLQIAISFGYPMEAEAYSAPPRKGGRRSISDIVHWERW